jgi:hypothetical protein
VSKYSFIVWFIGYAGGDVSLSVTLCVSGYAGDDVSLSVIDCVRGYAGDDVNLSLSVCDTVMLVVTNAVRSELAFMVFTSNDISINDTNTHTANLTTHYPDTI